MKEEIERFYWENGQVSCEIPWKGNKRNGICRSWHKNGNLRYENVYVDNFCYGLEMMWNLDNSIVHLIPFKKSIICGMMVQFQY